MPMNPLLRRVLVPLLIITLPIAAMVAYILYYQKAKLHKPPQAATAVSFGQSDWPFFRGNAAQTGVTIGQLPDKFAVVWTFKTKDEIKSTPVVADGKVYITSTDKTIYCLSLDKGELLWSYPVGTSIEASPLVYDQTVYVGGEDGTLYALNAVSGAAIWTYKASDKITGSVNLRTKSQTETELFFGCYDGRLTCLNAKIGGEKWFYSAQSYINGSPAVAENVAVFGSCDASLYIVPLDDPNAAKTFDSGSYIATSLALSDGKAYFGNFAGQFYCVDIHTAKELWSDKQSREAFFSSPAVNDRYVVVGNRDKKVYCFNANDGTIVWTFAGGTEFDGSPVIVGDDVLIGGNDGKLYRIALSTGQGKIVFDAASPIPSGVAIANSRILIACEDGTVYALGAPN